MVPEKLSPGMHVEMGAALALDKPIILSGPYAHYLTSPGSIFYALTARFETHDQAMRVVLSTSVWWCL
jgi:hypothetical protein